MPLKVRLYYVNQYYDMARQAYKKQFTDHCVKVQKLKQNLTEKAAMAKRRESISPLVGLASSAVFSIVDQIEEFTKRRDLSKDLKEEEPMFQSHIIK